MRPDLRLRCDRLEERKAKLFERLGGLSDEVLNRRPPDDGWSVIQVVAHLSLAEELSVRYLAKKLAEGGADAPRAGFGSAFRSGLLTLALRSPLRFKAPTRSTDVPERATFSEVAAHWDTVRSSLLATVEAVPPEVADRAIFKHPRAGRINLDQALSFMEEHFDHHLRQIDRVLAAVA